MRPRLLYWTVPAAAANNILLSQTLSGTTPALINGSLASGGVATLSSGTTTAFTPTGGCWQRRIRLTCAADDHARSITITGTILIDGKSYVIGEVMAGSISTTTDSLNDYATITSIVGDGGSWAGAITVGTNGVASTPWLRWDTDVPCPFAIGLGITLVSGAANFTVEHTFDRLPPDRSSPYITTPNFTPHIFPHSSVANKSASIDGNYAFPIQGCRLTTNSGTGVLLMQAGQAGIVGGPGSDTGEWST